MNTKLNQYDFTARSQNQLMSLVFHLEMLGVDTRDVELDDWKESTLRLSLEYNLDHHRPKLFKVHCGDVYKKERTYLLAESRDIEICTFERIIGITKIIEQQI